MEVEDVRRLKELVSVAMRSGLEISTCEDLLKKGWTYVEDMREPARWISPLARLQR